ncbi:MAG TPA: MgtC/SapB family protein [Pirellulaceae bacterium]|nr:MgtC/SapB family protein [Pirellulaceae bacterium]
MDYLEQASRLGAAALAAGAIGLERELRDKTAGLRTHLLVAIGSATFIMISEIGLSAYAEGEEPPNLDRMRTLAGLIGGIGFLGAGAILRDRGGIKGLTTAASLWTAASLGAAAGFGFFGLTLLATTLALFVLVPVQFLEMWLNPRERKRVRRSGHKADGDSAAPNELTTKPPTAP